MTKIDYIILIILITFILWVFVYVIDTMHKQSQIIWNINNDISYVRNLLDNADACEEQY